MIFKGKSPPLITQYSQVFYRSFQTTASSSVQQDGCVGADLGIRCPKTRRLFALPGSAVSQT